MKIIKKVFLIAFLFLGIHAVLGQAYKKMMNDPKVNIYDVVKEAESYFEDKDKFEKGSGWKGYQRWLNENEPKFYPSGDRRNVNPNFTAKNFNKFLKKNPFDKSLFNGGWEELGPYYIEKVTGHYNVGLGRVECFYADRNNTNIIYLGSRSGGFWKTIDGGENWIGGSTDTLIASGVNTMTVSPTNSDSILINVRNANNGYTHGIYRSIDAGDSWMVTDFKPTALGWGGLGSAERISQIAYHSITPNLVFIAGSKGLYRSDDNLKTWSRVYNLEVEGIAFHPTDPNVIYATSGNSIIVSLDGGGSFGIHRNSLGSSSPLRLSVSAACPNCIYAASSSGVWKSEDQGRNFKQISSVIGKGNYGGFAVSDVDTNYILFGSQDIYMSPNEGQTFNKVTTWYTDANYKGSVDYVHADIRGAHCQDGVFWVNTDGFLCKSVDNGVTWKIYEGQSIRENYNLGVSQSNHERTITGSQDNGSSIKTENSWVEFDGADGMEGIIHPLNDNWIISSRQYGSRRRTKDGGVTQLSVVPRDGNFDRVSGTWIAPLFYDPNNQMTVYSISDTIYKSTDFGSSWHKKGSPFPFANIRNRTYATIAENNSDIIVFTNSSDVKKSMDGGNTFQGIDAGLPNSSIRDVAFDPNDDDVIVVVYGSYVNDGQKVYITTDQGISWQNISYNLNDIPVRSVVIDHTDASTIYLGTEMGVYKKAMTDAVWSLYSPKLPNMAVLELEVVYGSNALRAATWGRGLWEYTLDGRQDYPTILTTKITNQPTESIPVEGQDQFVTSTITYDNTITSAYVEWSINAPIFGNVIPMTNTMDSIWVSDTPISSQPAGTKVYFKVFAIGIAGDTTETYKFMYTVKSDCVSGGNMRRPTAVTLVDFNQVNNSTAKTQPYTDYSSTDSTTVVIGNAYDLSVNLNTADNISAIYSKVWIDWNQDDDFEDIGEAYDLGVAENTANGPTTSSPLNITVPTTALVGKTIMRVTAKYGSIPTPCENDFSGEVEDYRIIVSNSVGVNENRAIDAPLIYPNPNNGIFLIDLRKDYESVSVSITDITGRLIQSNRYKNKRMLNLKLTNPPGIYILTVQSGEQKSVVRLLKE